MRAWSHLGGSTFVSKGDTLEPEKGRRRPDHGPAAGFCGWEVGAVLQPADRDSPGPEPVGGGSAPEKRGKVATAGGGRPMIAGADPSTPEVPRVAAALRYRPWADGAPRVVAAGRQRMAQAIVREAHRAGVPVIPSPVARFLAAVPVGQEIPVALYQAVAELLAFAWELERRWSGLEDGQGGGKEQVGR